MWLERWEKGRGWRQSGSKEPDHFEDGRPLEICRQRTEVFLLLQCDRKARNLVSVSGKVAQSCPNLCNPVDYSPPGSSVHGILQGKNTGVGCHSLLQGIFLT